MIRCVEAVVMSAGRDCVFVRCAGAGGGICFRSSCVFVRDGGTYIGDSMTTASMRDE
jgi:hypothetical protein